MLSLTAAVFPLALAADIHVMAVPEEGPDSSQPASPDAAAAHTISIQTATAEAQTAAEALRDTASSPLRSTAATARTLPAAADCRLAAYLCKLFLQ